MSAVRWGILATGLIADLFTRDLVLAGRQVTAVGSRQAETAERFARAHRIARAHASYQALCTDPDVDVVYVATPHPQHAAAARMALEAGKHVLVEKAFTLNAAEAHELVDLAASKGLVILEAMWTRFLPHMVRLREILAAGTIGEVRSLTADHRQKLPDDPAHRLNALELGGGALLDLGIYPISFAWDVLGRPDRIQALATFHATGADRQVATVMHYPGGALATTLSSSDSAGPNRAAVVGTHGRIELDRTWYCPTTMRVFDADNHLIDTFDGATSGRGMQFQAFEMERLIAEGRTEGTILPPSESAAIMETLDEIRRQIGLVYPQEG